MAQQKQKTEWWTNRIIQYGEMSANQFLAHEMNARRHPAKQREALRGSLDSVGWIAPVLVSARTGKTLDGHARIEEALGRDEMMRVPYIEVDVSETEERLILATLDPITELAIYDKEALDSLLRDLETGNAALMEMLGRQAERNGLMLAESQQAEDQTGMLRDRWEIVVTLSSEFQQTALLDRLTEEGYKCRALIA